jgi:hypothetical protein
LLFEIIFIYHVFMTQLKLSISLIGFDVMGFEQVQIYTTVENKL